MNPVLFLRRRPFVLPVSDFLRFEGGAAREASRVLAGLYLATIAGRMVDRLGYGVSNGLLFHLPIIRWCANVSFGWKAAISLLQLTNEEIQLADIEARLLIVVACQLEHGEAIFVSCETAPLRLV